MQSNGSRLRGASLSPSPARSSPNLARRSLGAAELAPVGLVAVVYAGAGSCLGLGWISGRVALVAAVAATTALYTALLVARALKIRSGTSPFGPFRGTGFLGMGVLAGGLSMIAGATVTGPRGTWLMVVAVAVSAVLFLLGLLLLPGAAPTVASRLRRVLDGSAIGTCLFFAAWTFGVTPLSAVHPAAVSREATTAILLAIVLSAALAAIALTAARAARRPGSTLCCGGAAVALVQQSSVVMLLLLGAGWSLALAASAVWATGPALMWVAARRSVVQTAALRHVEAPSTRFPPTLPLLALSAALGLFSAVYYLLVFGSWGVYTAMIATSAAGAVGTRGMFAALDVYRYTTRLRAQETRFLTTDALTGIPNRLRLRHRLDVERARVGVGERCATLLVIDLDDFGNLDAVRGHDLADEVLMEVARRLRVAVGPNDLAARLAGDSFAVLTTSSPRQGAALAGRLRARLAEPYRPAESEPGAVHLTASIGVAECNAAASVDEMIRCAELAVSRAKEHGGDRVEHYDESLQLRVLRRQTFAHELRGALQRGEFDLLFSPVAELADGTPARLRTHVRWLHPTLGEVSAPELAAAAADTGLLTEIGDWTLRQVCRQLGSWISAGRDVRAAVRVSAVHLRTPGFVNSVMQLHRAYGIPPQRLFIEISQRGLPPAEAIAAPLAALQDAGVHAWLGDFDGGACSLIDLQELPLAALMIDESLVARLDDREPIVVTIAGLARQLGLDVIADGVRDTRQAQRLEASGCRYGHGPLFSPPIPAERAEAYLDAHPGGPDSGTPHP